MASTGLEAFFLGEGAARLFCLLHHPPAARQLVGSLIYLHPFAEEMNKSRRMAALQARALAEAGWMVLQADMRGCGDSAGDFGAATWQAWVDDALRLSDWLTERSGRRPVLWGLRAGCLLAAAVARTHANSHDLLFWQPVLAGKQHLQQFLRLKVAGAMLGEGRQAGGSTRGMRDSLQAGLAVEVAGYLLRPELALGLDAATLAPPAAGGRLKWIELSAAAVPEIAPGSRQSIATWQAAGWQVEVQMLSGAAFWQTQEIEEVPGLIARTLVMLGGTAS